MTCISYNISGSGWVLEKNKLKIITLWEYIVYHHVYLSLKSDNTVKIPKLRKLINYEILNS